jgi:NADPH-dependent F420 reductase
LGSALARRICRAGYPVCIGSRAEDRARDAAARIDKAIPGARIDGRENRRAAEIGDIVILTVPFENQLATLTAIESALAGKLLIDTTVPLVPPKVARVQLPKEGAAALRAQALLGDAAEIVSAFHNVSAQILAGDGEIDCDVLVFGDKRKARERAMAVIGEMGLRGWHGGSLANSAAAEALTSVLIFINRHHDLEHAGIRITGG